MLAAALALAFGLTASPQPAAEGVELERVVAVVRAPGSSEATVITLTRLEAESRVALITRGATLAATQPLDGPALRAGLDWLVDEILLAAEAARLQIFEVDAAEREGELTRFRARLGGATYAAFLGRADLSEEELGAVLGRMLRVRRYVESRVNHAGQVSESELSAWLDEHAAALGTRDRDAARVHLAERRVAEEVSALLRDVRARAEVRLLGGLPAAAAAPTSSSGGVPDHEPRRQARR